MPERGASLLASLKDALPASSTGASRHGLVFGFLDS
jgi:hypothetical protein